MTPSARFVDDEDAGIRCLDFPSELRVVDIESVLVIGILAVWPNSGCALCSVLLVINIVSE